MYRAFIFDLDGTIINSEDAVVSARQMALRDIGINRTFDELRPMFGRPEIDTLKELGVKDTGAVIKLYMKHYLTCRDMVTVYDNIEYVLERLPLKGLVTSETRGELKINFIDRGFSKYMQAIVTADDTVLHKPHPEPLLHCLSLLECPPGQALYIGDSLFDMNCAAACGVDFGLALWGADKTVCFDKTKYRFSDPLDILKVCGDVPCQK